jgi:hypothetical protein
LTIDIDREEEEEETRKRRNVEKRRGEGEGDPKCGLEEDDNGELAFSFNSTLIIIYV